MSTPKGSFLRIKNSVAEKKICSGPCREIREIPLSLQMLVVDQGAMDHCLLEIGKIVKRSFARTSFFFLAAVCFMVFVSSSVWCFLVGTGKD